MDDLYKIIESITKSLKEEIDKTRYEREIIIPKKLHTAASHGDLSENAEYDAAKDERDFLDARLSQLMARLRDISEIDPKTLPGDRITIFSKVTLENADTGDEEQFYIVLPEMIENISKKEGMTRVSYTSPIAQQLMNKECGDLVTLTRRKQQDEFEIVAFISAQGELVE